MSSSCSARPRPRPTPRSPALTAATGLAGGKFENLNVLLAKAPERRPDWTLVVDDDVALPARFPRPLPRHLRGVRARPRPARPDAPQPFGLEGHPAAARGAGADHALRRDRAGHRLQARAGGGAAAVPRAALRLGPRPALGGARPRARLAPRRGRRRAGTPRGADGRGRLPAQRGRGGGRALPGGAPVPAERARRRHARGLPEAPGLAMRLLFVCPDMRTGGAERHWATLVPALRERGVEAGVLCLTGEGPFFGELRARGVPVTSIRMRGRFDLRRLAARARLCRDAARRGRLARRQRAARGRAHRPPRRGASRAERAHAGHGGRPARAASPAPARAHASRDAARRRGDRGQRQPGRAARGRSATANITVVPNGVFEADVADVAPSPEFEHDGFAALCVSGLRPEKRVDVFIEAVRAARRRERRRSAATSRARGARTRGSRRSPTAAASSCSACARTRAS